MVRSVADAGQHDEFRLRHVARQADRVQVGPHDAVRIARDDGDGTGDLAIARSLRMDLREQTGDVLGIGHELLRPQHQRDAGLLDVALLDRLRREDPGDAPPHPGFAHRRARVHENSGPASGLAASR